MFNDKKKKLDQELEKIQQDNLPAGVQSCDLSVKPKFEIPPFTKTIQLPRARIIEMQNYAKMLRKRNPTISEKKLTNKVSKKFHIKLV